MKKNKIYRYHRDTIRKCYWEMTLSFDFPFWKLTSTHLTADGDIIAIKIRGLSEGEAAEYFNDNDADLVEAYTAS